TTGSFSKQVQKPSQASSSAGCFARPAIRSTLLRHPARAVLGPNEGPAINHLTVGRVGKQAGGKVENTSFNRESVGLAGRRHACRCSILGTVVTLRCQYRTFHGAANGQFPSCLPGKIT